MNSHSIKQGAVVRDRHGRIGIVCEQEPDPPQGWIDEQRNVAEIKQLGPTEWWAVMPLDGGYTLSPGPLLVYLREASYDDFLAAADFAQPKGRETLVKLFPHHVNRLLAERRAREAD